MAERMLAEYLGKHCPSTRQLAAFVSEQMLPVDVLARILDDINQKSGGKEVDVIKGEDVEEEEVKEANASKEMNKIYNAVAVDDEDVQQEKGEQDEKDIIKRFLEFTNFPEELRVKMVEAFLEQAI